MFLARTFGFPVVPDEKHRNAIFSRACPGFVNLYSTYGGSVLSLTRSSTVLRGSFLGDLCPSSTIMRECGSLTAFAASMAAGRFSTYATRREGLATVSW